MESVPVCFCVCVAFASCVLVIELAKLAFATFQRLHYKRDMTYNSYYLVGSIYSRDCLHYGSNHVPH